MNSSACARLGTSKRGRRRCIRKICMIDSHVTCVMQLLCVRYIHEYRKYASVLCTDPHQMV